MLERLSEAFKIQRQFTENAAHELQTVGRDETIIVNALIDEVLADLEPLAQEKNIKLIGKCKDVNMVGSDILIYRLVYNLVENAIKYNHSGGQVIVEAYQKEKQVYLSVEDTGSGIPEELKERVFEPFFRVDKSFALAQANATGALVNQRAPDPDADTATLCEHAAALFMTAINGTQNTLSPEAVDEAVALLHKARQVYCLGQGGSMLIANDICARFASISTKFRTAGDSHLQLVTASLMTPEDVVLFVSYSGATRDMLETLKVAKAAGAKVILLTHYEDSPGAKLADIVLLCGAQESPLDAGNIPIKVAVLYVAEVLVLRYMLDDPDDANKAQDRTSEALAVKML